MMSKENYLFTKKLYYRLMLNFKKKGDDKNFEWAKNGWKEIEELYKDFDFKSIY